MKTICISITCEQCGQEYYKTVPQLIIGNWQAKEKEALLSQQLFITTCCFCQHQQFFLYPLIYYDNEKKFMVGLKKKIEKTGVDFYLVDTICEMSETIKILEDGLNIKKIEKIKQYLKEKYKVTNIKYKEYDIISKTIWFLLHNNQEVQWKGIYYDSYLQMDEKGRIL